MISEERVVQEEEFDIDEALKRVEHNSRHKRRFIRFLRILLAIFLTIIAPAAMLVIFAVSFIVCIYIGFASGDFGCFVGILVIETVYLNWIKNLFTDEVV